MIRLFLFSLLPWTLGAVGADQPTSGEAGSSASPEPLDGSALSKRPRHPIARNIAATYEVAYEQVMEWFSAGSSFEDILLALETDRLTELTVEDLLTRAAEVSWEQLWDETQLAGPRAL